jgi:hypothetical protein
MDMVDISDLAKPTPRPEIKRIKSIKICDRQKARRSCDRAESFLMGFPTPLWSFTRGLKIRFRFSGLGRLHNNSPKLRSRSDKTFPALNALNEHELRPNLLAA